MYNLVLALTMGLAATLFLVSVRPPPNLAHGRRDLIIRVVGPAMAVGFAHLAALGALIGIDGASRAYSVGLHTLFRDHLPAVVATGLGATLLAGLVGRTLMSIRESGIALVSIVIADAIVALGIVITFGEITLVDLPKAIVTETAAGTQLLAASLGLLVGYVMRTTPGRAAPSAPPD